MLICEDCRTRNNWFRKNAVETGDCEWCWSRNCQVSEITSFIRDQIPEIALELRKITQRQRNEDFKTMAEALCVFDTYGPKAGSFNNELTSQLRQIVVQVNGQTDWEATYQRRLRLKDAILKTETFEKDVVRTY